MNLRPQKGDSKKGDVRADRGSIYPDAFAQTLVLSQARLMGKVRMMELDPAMTADGNRDKCEKCGNRGRGGELWCCDNCPAAWHYRCVTGCLKPKRGERWFCPRAECQAKRAAP